MQDETKKLIEGYGKGTTVLLRQVTSKTVLLEYADFLEDTAKRLRGLADNLEKLDADIEKRKKRRVE